MRRKEVLIGILLAILAVFTGCAGGERDNPTLSADEVERVEVFRYVGAPAAAEKKTATERGEIEEICGQLASAGSPKAGEALSGGTVISFRVGLEDGTVYEMIFVENDGEDLAEFEAIWENMSGEAVAAGMDELPAY